MGEKVAIPEAVIHPIETQRRHQISQVSHNDFLDKLRLFGHRQQPPLQPLNPRMWFGRGGAVKQNWISYYLL